MKIELPPHAERQLQERNISFKEVVETLRHPDQQMEGSHRNRKIAQKIISRGGKNFLYRVIFKQENSKHIIITVYRTSKIKKYMKEANL